MTTKSIPYIGGKIEVVFNKADETPAAIQIYDDIGKDPWTGEGFSAKDMAAALKEIQPRNRELKISVNSRGGDVNEGKAIRSMLEDWPGRIVNVIDGVAASTASWMIPADEVQARNHSQVFIHKSWAMVVGNADDMGKAVAMLNTTDEQIADIYAKKTGKGREAMMQLMADETLLTGQSAKELGLVDKIIDGDAVHNFSAAEILNMKKKLAAMNSLKNISAPTQGADEQQKQQEKIMETENKALLTEQATKIAELENKVKAERAARIESAFNTLAATRPTLNREEWLPKCLADEAVLNLAQKFPESPVAGNIASGVQVLGNPAVEAYNKMTAGPARNAFRVQHHNILSSFQPKNSNTIDSALIPDYLSDALITILNNRLASFSGFSMGIGLNPLAPKQTVQVSYASAGSTTLTDATNFEQGDSTLAGQPVTVSQYTQPFHLTNAQIQQGIQIAKLAQVNANALANKLSDVVTALWIAANYGAATTIGTAANFDSADLRPVLALAKNYTKKVLLLDGGHLAYLLPTNKDSFKIGEMGAYGFDSILEQNRWTGGIANLAGVVLSPDALCIASGTPLNLPSSEFLSQQTIQLVNGMSVVASSWYSRGSRQVWMSYDVMFGAGVGDDTTAELLVTA